MVLFGQIRQLHDSGAFRFKVSLLTFLVFFFKVASFVAIMSLLWVVLVILTEDSPGVEIVPEAEEYSNRFDVL